jgi:hypothetical protein
MERISIDNTEFDLGELRAKGTRMTRHRPIAAFLTAAAAVVATLVVAAPARADTPLSFTVSIQSNASLKCLQPANGQGGAAIIQMPCNHSDAQTWRFYTRSDGYIVVNVGSDMCLDAFGGAANGTPVVQWPDVTGPGCPISNMKWTANRALPDVVTLRSRVAGTSNYCLDVPGSGTADGLAVQIWGCNGTAAQAWGVGVMTIQQ